SGTQEQGWQRRRWDKRKRHWGTNVTPTRDVAALVRAILDFPAIQKYGRSSIYTGFKPMSDFEWDPTKDRINQAKHGVGFELAQHAFLDPWRVIAEDLGHSDHEQRYYCFGRIDDGIMTVRFTWRNGKIRIFGAGYWRKGKAIYEEANG